MQTKKRLFSCTKVIDIINNPAFEGFGRYLFPIENGMPGDDMRLDEISSLLPYHSSISSDTSVEVINYMLDKVNNGEIIFYDIYPDEDKQADPSKRNTGLFFYRSRSNAPFAIVCAGGGFKYVGSIHEGFPIALELTKKGYNAFVIQYRTGGAEVACEDLAAAISFIFKNAESLSVCTNNYSLWGSSAGARMAAYLGSYSSMAYGGDNLPKPAAVIMQYTALSDYNGNEPPTYAIIGENDNIAAPSIMKQRIEALKAAGIDTEFHIYPNLGHGFGLGIGTTAEGWLDNAAAFWERYINKAK